jgi:hypothetical protein
MIFLRVWLLVAAVVDKGGETGGGNATGSECKVVKDKGDTRESEANIDNRIEKTSHLDIS